MLTPVVTTVATVVAGVDNCEKHVDNGAEDWDVHDMFNFDFD